MSGRGGAAVGRAGTDRLRNPYITPYSTPTSAPPVEWAADGGGGVGPGRTSSTGSDGASAPARRAPLSCALPSVYRRLCCASAAPLLLSMPRDGADRRKRSEPQRGAVRRSRAVLDTASERRGQVCGRSRGNGKACAKRQSPCARACVGVYMLACATSGSEGLPIACAPRARRRPASRRSPRSARTHARPSTHRRSRAHWPTRLRLAHVRGGDARVGAGAAVGAGRRRVEEAARVRAFGVGRAVPCGCGRIDAGRRLQQCRVCEQPDGSDGVTTQRKRCRRLDVGPIEREGIARGRRARLGRPVRLRRPLRLRYKSRTAVAAVAATLYGSVRRSHLALLRQERLDVHFTRTGTRAQRAAQPRLLPLLAASASTSRQGQACRMR